MIILMLALQTVAPATVMLRTPESETLNGYDLSCTIADAGWKRHRIELTQRGGLAFAAAGDDTAPQIFQTPAYSRVIVDQTGKLAGMGRFEKMIEKPGYGYSTKPIELAGGNGRASVTLAEVTAQQFAITIVQTSGSNRNSFAGFCSVKIIPQVPLTKSELAAHLRDPWRIP